MCCTLFRVFYPSYHLILLIATMYEKVVLYPLQHNVIVFIGKKRNISW